MAGLQDLFAQLDAASATLRAQDYAAGRPGLTMSSLPRVTDGYLASPGWRPPIVTQAKKEAQELYASGHRHKPSFCTTTRAAGEFSSTGMLKGQALDHWESLRVMQPDRVFNNPKGHRGYCPRPGAEFPAPQDGMCSEMHRNWLQGHYAQRARHLHPVDVAVKRVEQLRSALKENDDAIKCAWSDEERSELVAKAEKLEKRLAKAESDPVLVRVPTPDGHVRHLRKFAGPERAGKTFQQSAPWQALTEERELLNRGTGTLRRSASTRALPALPQAPKGDLTQQLQRAKDHVAQLEAALATSHSAADLRPSVPRAGGLATSVSAGALPAAAARPTTGRPPTGAFGTSRAYPTARPQTGARLAGAGAAAVAAR